MSVCPLCIATPVVCVVVDLFSLQRVEPRLQEKEAKTAGEEREMEKKASVSLNSRKMVSNGRGSHCVRTRLVALLGERTHGPTREQIKWVVAALVDRFLGITLGLSAGLDAA